MATADQSSTTNPIVRKSFMHYICYLCFLFKVFKLNQSFKKYLKILHVQFVLWKWNRHT